MILLLLRVSLLSLVIMVAMVDQTHAFSSCHSPTTTRCPDSIETISVTVLTKTKSSSRSTRSTPSLFRGGLLSSSGSSQQQRRQRRPRSALLGSTSSDSDGPAEPFHPDWSSSSSSNHQHPQQHMTPMTMTVDDSNQMKPSLSSSSSSSSSMTPPPAAKTTDHIAQARPEEDRSSSIPSFSRGDDSSKNMDSASASAASWTLLYPSQRMMTSKTTTPTPPSTTMNPNVNDKNNNNNNEGDDNNGSISSGSSNMNAPITNAEAAVVALKNTKIPTGRLREPTSTSSSSSSSSSSAPPTAAITPSTSNDSDKNNSDDNKADDDNNKSSRWGDQHLSSHKNGIRNNQIGFLYPSQYWSKSTRDSDNNNNNNNDRTKDDKNSPQIANSNHPKGTNDQSPVQKTKSSIASLAQTWVAMKQQRHLGQPRGSNKNPSASNNKDSTSIGVNPRPPEPPQDANLFLTFSAQQEENQGGEGVSMGGEQHDKNEMDDDEEEDGDGVLDLAHQSMAWRVEPDLQDLEAQALDWADMVSSSQLWENSGLRRRRLTEEGLPMMRLSSPLQPLGIHKEQDREADDPENETVGEWLSSDDDKGVLQERKIKPITFSPQPPSLDTTTKLTSGSSSTWTPTTTSTTPTTTRMKNLAQAWATLHPPSVEVAPPNWRTLHNNIPTTTLSKRTPLSSSPSTTTNTRIISGPVPTTTTPLNVADLAQEWAARNRDHDYDNDSDPNKYNYNHVVALVSPVETPKPNVVVVAEATQEAAEATPPLAPSGQNSGTTSSTTSSSSAVSSSKMAKFSVATVFLNMMTTSSPSMVEPAPQLKSLVDSSKQTSTTKPQSFSPSSESHFPRSTMDVTAEEADGTAIITTPPSTTKAAANMINMEALAQEWASSFYQEQTEQTTTATETWTPEAEIHYLKPSNDDDDNSKEDLIKIADNHEEKEENSTPPLHDMTTTTTTTTTDATMKNDAEKEESEEAIEVRLETNDVVDVGPESNTMIHPKIRKDKETMIMMEQYEEQVDNHMEEIVIIDQTVQQAAVVVATEEEEESNVTEDTDMAIKKKSLVLHQVSGEEEEINRMIGTKMEPRVDIIEEEKATTTTARHLVEKVQNNDELLKQQQEEDGATTANVLPVDKIHNELTEEEEEDTITMDTVVEEVPVEEVHKELTVEGEDIRAMETVDEEVHDELQEEKDMTPMETVDVVLVEEVHDELQEEEDMTIMETVDVVLVEEVHDELQEEEDMTTMETVDEAVHETMDSVDEVLVEEVRDELQEEEDMTTMDQVDKVLVEEVRDELQEEKDMTTMDQVDEEIRDTMDQVDVVLVDEEVRDTMDPVDEVLVDEEDHDAMELVDQIPVDEDHDKQEATTSMEQIDHDDEQEEEERTTTTMEPVAVIMENTKEASMILGAGAEEQDPLVGTIEPLVEELDEAEDYGAETTMELPEVDDEKQQDVIVSSGSLTQGWGFKEEDEEVAQQTKEADEGREGLAMWEDPVMSSVLPVSPTATITPSVLLRDKSSFPTNSFGERVRSVQSTADIWNSHRDPEMAKAPKPADFNILPRMQAPAFLDLPRSEVSTTITTGDVANDFTWVSNPIKPTLVREETCTEEFDEAMLRRHEDEEENVPDMVQSAELFKAEHGVEAAELDTGAFWGRVRSIVESTELMDSRWEPELPPPSKPADFYILPRQEETSGFELHGSHASTTATMTGEIGNDLSWMSDPVEPAAATSLFIGEKDWAEEFNEALRTITNLGEIVNYLSVASNPVEPDAPTSLMVEEAFADFNKALFISESMQEGDEPDLVESSEIIKALYAAAKEVTATDESVSTRANLLKLHVLRVHDDTPLPTGSVEVPEEHGIQKEWKKTSLEHIISRDALEAVRANRSHLFQGQNDKNRMDRP